MPAPPFYLLPKDFIRQETTTTGTGDLTLGATPAGFSAFNTQYTTGYQFYYTIKHTTIPAEVETGLGTYTASGGIARVATTGGNTNFSAGTKTVSVVMGAPFYMSVHNQFKNIANVLDYGADPGGTADSLAAFQAAVDTGRNVFIPYGDYKLTDDVVVTTDYQQIIGDEKMPFVRQYTTDKPCFTFTTAVGNFYLQFARLCNIVMYHQGLPSFAAPAKTNAAVVLDGTNSTNEIALQRTTVENCRILGFGCGVWANNHVNTLLDRLVIEQHTASVGAYGSHYCVGIYLSGVQKVTPGASPNASCEVNNIIFGASGVDSDINSYGIWLDGVDLRDVYMTNCELTMCDIGIYIKGSGNMWDWNIHINRPTIDAFQKYGILIDAMGGPGRITINGGGSAARGGTATVVSHIWVEASNGVNITGGYQFLGMPVSGASDDGVRIHNSTGCSVTNCSLQNLSYGISLQGATSCTITGNTIDATVNTLDPTPVLNDAIRVFGTSIDNNVSNNTIRGASASYKYTNGVNIEAGSGENNFVANVIDTTTVTNRYNNLAADNLVIDRASNILMTAGLGELLSIGAVSN